MTTLTIYTSGRLTASVEDRVLSGLLLPFGEPGRTNLGTVTVKAGALEVPTDLRDFRLNVEHVRTAVTGRAVALAETPVGITAAFLISKTRAGDDALVEAQDGLRAALSVEVDDPVIRNGQLIAGRITGAAQVVEPAFSSASLSACNVHSLCSTIPPSSRLPSARVGICVDTSRPAKPATSEEMESASGSGIKVMSW